MHQNIVALSSIGRSKSPSEPRGCATTSRSDAMSCGTAQRADDLPQPVWEKIQDHPCYSEDAHHYFARMHIAVAPACNIQCNYCNRKYDCSNESRPGVVSEKLTPQQALEKTLAVAAEVPQLSVVGVAGPGDALANADRTFAAFELVAKALPHLKLCLSTNGLALPDHVDRIVAMGVDHVTITINMIDPQIGAQIYPWIFFRHRRWEGVDASRILHERQMEGLEALTARGVLVKVNSVLIPGVNDGHLKAVNEAVRARGAFLHNVMPLISDAAHGTHFGLTGRRGPTPDELRLAQDRLGANAKLMRHCRQCRADAVGLLGEDRGAEFTLDRLEAPEPFDPRRREMYLSVVERERSDRRKADEAAQLGMTTPDSPVLVAVATKGGGRINLHFGHATEFQIYEVHSRGARFVGHRRTETYCGDGHGEDAAMEATIAALRGVSAVLCAKIGERPRERLAAVGVTATDQYAFEYIEASAIAWCSRQLQSAERAASA
jgi:nitrogen fixation protein NifB